MATVVFVGAIMHILYVDESGDLGAMPYAPLPTGNDQPVLIIGGLIVDARWLEKITHDFLDLKYRFHPNLPYPTTNHLDKILPEVKGSQIRHQAVRGKPEAMRHAIGFLDKLLAMLKKHDVRLLSRIWVKRKGGEFKGRHIYTSSIQWLHTSFDNFLSDHDSFGFCIADSRDYLMNVYVAHSVFTQKFSSSTNVYARILELPAFGHSQNHAVIQICDIVCSALLFPIASETYCTGYVENVHVQPGAAALRERFGAAIDDLQYRYKEPLGRWNGGIVVSDPIEHRNASHMFKCP